MISQPFKDHLSWDYNSFLLRSAVFVCRARQLVQFFVVATIKI